MTATSAATDQRKVDVTDNSTDVIDDEITTGTSDNEDTASTGNNASADMACVGSMGSADTTDEAPPANSRRWVRLLAYVVVPALIVIAAAGVGYLRWQQGSASSAQQAIAQSLSAATESTVAMLSYTPDRAEHDLNAARDRLTGSFRDEYAKLITDVVIPGSKQKRITAAATVPAAASVSATGTHAVVLVYINQTITTADGAPTTSSSTARVTLEKVGNRWLISAFEPI